ncbi:hypothetical protein CAPTEDRAFT_139754, partial [Capitella teleta]
SPDPPNAPQDLSAKDVTTTSCTLTWEPPENDGGSPITGYHIERCVAGSSRWLRITKEPVTEREFLAEDFVEGNEYCFRIVALNKVGEGPPGPKSQVVEAKDPWSNS